MILRSAQQLERGRQSMTWKFSDADGFRETVLQCLVPLSKKKKNILYRLKRGDSSRTAVPRHTFHVESPIEGLSYGDQYIYVISAAPLIW